MQVYYRYVNRMYNINRHESEFVYLVRWAWILAAWKLSLKCIGYYALFIVLYLPCICLKFHRNHPRILKPFLIFTLSIGNVFNICFTDFPSYWLADLSHKMCLLTTGIASALHIVGWPKIDLQILYLTGLELPVGMKVPAHLMVY